MIFNVSYRVFRVQTTGPPQVDVQVGHWHKVPLEEGGGDHLLVER